MGAISKAAEAVATMRRGGRLVGDRPVATIVFASFTIGQSGRVFERVGSRKLVFELVFADAPRGQVNVLAGYRPKCKSALDISEHSHQTDENKRKARWDSAQQAMSLTVASKSVTDGCGIERRILYSKEREVECDANSQRQTGRQAGRGRMLMVGFTDTMRTGLMGRIAISCGQDTDKHRNATPNTHTHTHTHTLKQAGATVHSQP